MQPADTVYRSPLNKPLHQLTEDDISQLTREDCRRYLKEKGMRKPSWNKSQAIQQVISLKTLLETTPDSGTVEARKRLHIPRPDKPHRALASFSVSVNGTSVNTPISVLAEESIPYRRHDPPKFDFPGDLSTRLTATENDSVSPRTTGAANEPAGQMTIFYCGKLNVYDDVPIDKAQVIMQLAASPLPLPQEVSLGVIPALWPFSCQLETSGVKAAASSPLVNCPTPQKDGPTSRKASIQRYLEKRKDRFKNKRKVAMSSSVGSDASLNCGVGDQTLNDHWSVSDACSPPHPITPQMLTRCSSIENIAKNANPLAVCNDEDVQEC